MSKKSLICGMSISLFVVSLVFAPQMIRAGQYYLHYTGSSFHAKFENLAHTKVQIPSYLYHQDTRNGYYYCPVNFNESQGSSLYIKSMAVRYYDFLTDGYIYVQLKRQNLYTGNYHTIASWTSGEAFSSTSILTANKASIDGYKLIDSKKFAYWIHVYIYRDGDVSPEANIKLYQVRIHYGT